MVDDRSGKTVSLAAPWRMGIDVGGTFTDLALLDAGGGVHVFKVASTPTEPALGVVNVIEYAAQALRMSCSELLSKCALFVHGSTIATNALLEGKGARVGLLATQGFRDSLEIRRGIRRNAWDHRAPYPAVLVPRFLRRPVAGRIDRHGAEVEALNTEDVVQAARYFEAEAVESVAICLFNSFLNDSHECRAQELIGDELSVPVNRSSVLAPIMGEYERTSTAVVSAYVAPRVTLYLRDLNARIESLGLKIPMLVVQNNGGLANVRSVIEHPATLLLSGPAAATGALKQIAEVTGTDNLISMEVGGTSCDVILLHDGEVAITDAFDIADYHVGLSAAEIHTIGAGGGTLAGCDEAGMLWVGPSGAGAQPGPACYGLGGLQPTVTDAELVLGRLAPGPFADGSFSLHLDKAEQVIFEQVAVPLDLGVEAAAAGVLRLVEQKLTQAIESVTSAQGHDPREFVLVAAGGAGPLLASAVARQLGCRQVYVPRTAGTLCALGMALSDVTHEFATVHLARLEGAALEPIETILAELVEKGRAQLIEDGFGSDKMRFEASLSLRYPGQIGDMRIGVPAQSSINLDTLVEHFSATHERLYGYSHSSSAVDVCAVRVVAVGDLEHLSCARFEKRGEAGRPHAQRDVYFDTLGACVATDIYVAADLQPRQIVTGPAIVEASTTTVLVYPGDVLEVDDYGSFVIRLMVGDEH